MPIDPKTMPLYVSHKVVRALEIDHVVTGPNPLLVFRDKAFRPITVPVEMFSRYIPTRGDFYVVYADGYESFSPRKTFLDGYSPQIASPIFAPGVLPFPYPVPNVTAWPYLAVFATVVVLVGLLLFWTLGGHL